MFNHYEYEFNPLSKQLQSVISEINKVQVLDEIYLIIVRTILSLVLNTNYNFCHSSYFDDVHIIMIFTQICVHGIKYIWSLLLCSIDIEVEHRNILYLVEIEVEFMPQFI